MKISVLGVLGSALVVPTVSLITGHVWPIVAIAALVTMLCAGLVMAAPHEPAVMSAMPDRRTAERRSAERRFSTSMAASVACALLASVFAVSVLGCTAQQKATTLQVAQEINKYAPTVESALDGAALSIAALDPAIASAVMVGVTGFDALSKTFNAALSAYLANPTASALADLQAAINSVEANVNAATVNALGIKDSASSALALAILKGTLTVASYVFSLIAETETAVQLNEVRAMNKMPLSELRAQMDEGKLRQFAQDRGAPKWLAGAAVDAAFDQAAAEGF